MLSRDHNILWLPESNGYPTLLYTGDEMMRTKNRSGVALPMMAMLSVVFLAFLGLVFDTGLLMWKKRTMQAAADAAAWDGAHENHRDNTTRIIGAGRYSARLNGYTHGIDGVTVDINRPPTTGPNQNLNHVEAIVRQTSALSFMPILGITQAEVLARAVAGEEASGEFCVLALDQNAPDALLVDGSSGVTANCGFRSNSCVTEPGGVGFGVKGSSSLTLMVNEAGHQPTPLACGDVKVQGAANTEPDLVSDGNTEPDPFFGRTPPTLPGAPVFVDIPNITNGSGNVVLAPGHYQSTGNSPAIQITGGNVTFSDGLFITEGVHINGGTITANDITIFNTGNGKTIDINGNGSLTMVARSVNDSPAENLGILFWCDATMPNVTNKFNGTASDTLTGVIYCPSQHLEWSGNHSTAGDGTWNVFVSSTMKFTGNSAVNVNEPPAGILPEFGLETIVMKE